MAFLLDKSEWTTNITKLNELVSWLGFSTECFFEELLELNTGGTKGFDHTKKEFTKTNPLNNKNCYRLLQQNDLYK